MPPTLYRLGFVAATVLAVAAAAWLGGPPDPTAQVAKRLQAERWYSVGLHGMDIGHFRSAARMTRAGYSFDSELVFRLGTGPETRIAETRVFGSFPPYPLVTAEHSYETADDTMHVGIERSAAGLTASANGQVMALDWEYRMDDYLAVERWLDREQAINAELDSKSLDFDRLSLKQESWRIIGRNETGYRLQNRDRSTVQLNGDHVPVRLSLANLFDMTLEGSSRVARAWRRGEPGTGARSYHVTIDRPLDTPRDLTRLLLRVRAADPIDEDAWPMLQRDAKGDLVLESRRNAWRRAAPEEIEALSAATALYPATDREIQRLARQAVSGLTDPAGRIETLVRFVNGYIDYAEEASPRTVGNILRDRRGDCTEYANLLTTMARALGFAARTVTGLAYDIESESFALHNWSEVALDGWWIPVDPTWDQVPADAGHLRLPDRPGLAVFGLLSNIEFELVQAEYGQPNDHFGSSNNISSSPHSSSSSSNQWIPNRDGSASLRSSRSPMSFSCSIIMSR
ncbi:MAG: transglutaminase domain-containing protein [Gammaproteobacteria bacterium]|nr:transglutaminase domain-containing protein [Gammaproteobacteria bacterium]